MIFNEDFTEEYLKGYKEQIQKLPYGELYEVLDVVRKDRTPERLKIVEARIEELDNLKAEKSKRRKEKKTDSGAKNSRSIGVLDRITAVFPDPKPQKKLPDIKGLVYFIIFYGLLVPGVFMSLLLIGINCGLSGFATIEDVLPVAVFAMPCIAFVLLIAIRYFLKKERDYKKLFVYWMRHQKLASAVTFYGLVLSITALVTGSYRGLLCVATGSQALEIAVAVLMVSLLFAANMFFPLSRANRPKNGLGLLMVILAMDYALRMLQ